MILQNYCFDVFRLACILESRNEILHERQRKRSKAQIVPMLEPVE